MGFVGSNEFDPTTCIALVTVLVEPQITRSMPGITLRNVANFMVKIVIKPRHRTMFHH